MEERLHTAPASTATIEPTPSRRRFGMVALYSATLVVSATLVFMVQPMFARFVLPLLGGTPAVWTTAMLFFQTALLLAYLYAHWTTRRFGPRRQAALHLALVAAALLVLPLGLPDGWTPPVDSSPVPWLLLLLLVSVGLPFFVVSSTAPLLQCWLADTDHPDGRDPYFLYRASNIGSVIGLLSYPLLVERELTLDAQSWLWSAGYGLLALLLSGSALMMWRSRRPAADTPRDRRRRAGGTHQRRPPGALGHARLRPVEPDAGRHLGDDDEPRPDPAALGAAAVAVPGLVHPRLLARRGRGAVAPLRALRHAAAGGGARRHGRDRHQRSALAGDRGQPGRLLRRGARDARGAGRRPAISRAADPVLRLGFRWAARWAACST